MIESANLKSSAAKGLFWSAIDRIGAQGIQFIFGILITRILLPEDYGLVGMILIFMAVGQTLIDSGFGSALIWKRNSTSVDYSTVFYFNISVSALLYVIVYFLAPFISDFYEEPRLIPLIRILCLNFIFISFSYIQQILLQKKVDFKILSVINIIGSLFSGMLSFYLAIKGFGVWAIIYQILSKSLITAIFLWIFNKWRPHLEFSWISLRQLFGYGSKLTVAGLINTIFQYLYFNIIGKIFPIASLGFYTRAVQIQEFPVKTISNIFQRVTFPVFSSIQDEPERLKNAVRKTIKSMVFITFPVLFGLIAVSDYLIEVVLTEKWLPASEYFKLLCLVGLFYTLGAINGEILKTRGKPNWILKLELITKIILVLNIFITYKWGISAIILGHLCTVFVSYILVSYYVWKLIDYSLWQQFKDISVYLLLSVFMFIVVYLLSLMPLTPIIKLVLMTITGAFFYSFLAWLLDMDEFNELIVLLKRN